MQNVNKIELRKFVLIAYFSISVASKLTEDCPDNRSNIPNTSLKHPPKNRNLHINHLALDVLCCCFEILVPRRRNFPFAWSGNQRKIFEHQRSVRDISGEVSKTFSRHFGEPSGKFSEMQTNQEADKSKKNKKTTTIRRPKIGWFYQVFFVLLFCFSIFSCVFQRISGPHRVRNVGERISCRYAVMSSKTHGVAPKDDETTVLKKRLVPNFGRKYVWVTDRTIFSQQQLGEATRRNKSMHLGTCFVCFFSMSAWKEQLFNTISVYRISR